MSVIYLLTLAWLLLFAGLVVITVFYTLAWLQCENLSSTECIDYNQFSEYLALCTVHLGECFLLRRTLA